MFQPQRTHQLAAHINFARQMVGQTPGSTAAYLSLAMRNRPNRTHVLQQTHANCPVMFIAGKNDPAAPFDALSDVFFMPPHSHILALDQTAHMAMYEHPSLCLNHLLAFVQMATAFAV